MHIHFCTPVAPSTASSLSRMLRGPWSGGFWNTAGGVPTKPLWPMASCAVFRGLMVEKGGGGRLEDGGVSCKFIRNCSFFVRFSSKSTPIPANTLNKTHGRRMWPMKFLLFLFVSRSCLSAFADPFSVFRPKDYTDVPFF